jgi:hypothetical protein
VVVHLERGVLALDWSRLRCESCGHESEGSAERLVAFARSLSEVALQCSSYGKDALVPSAYAPDPVESRARKIVVEIYGEKSSARDASKIGFYKAKRFAVVTVPNGVADDPEYSKPVFQLLALVCGSDHPERLFTPEVG